MIELQLVGYTADLRYLVFCDAGESASRFKAPVDSDLLATVTEVVQLVDPDRAGLLLSLAPQALTEPEEPETPPNGRHREPRQGPLAALALVVPSEVEGSGNGQASAEPLRSRQSRLSPREIQALLRAGKSPQTVAKQAETDESWVRRWLPPIEAERDQVIQAVRQARVTKARLGPSRDLLGEAVRRNLTAKGLSPDDESVEWLAARGEADSFWKVTLRYRSRGRRQSAIWRFDPESGAVDPRNTLASDIAWTRARSATGPAKPGADRSVANSAGSDQAAAAKAGAAKGAAAKGAAAKGAAAKGAAAKGAAAKAGAGKSGAGKAGAGKSGAGQSGAAKSGGTKAAAAKSDGARAGGARGGGAKADGARAGGARGGGAKARGATAGEGRATAAAEASATAGSAASGAGAATRKRSARSTRTAPDASATRRVRKGVKDQPERPSS